MKICVFGASGGVGQKLVELGLSEGHFVTAMVYSTELKGIAFEPYPDDRRLRTDFVSEETGLLTKEGRNLHQSWARAPI